MPHFIRRLSSWDGNGAVIGRPLLWPASRVAIAVWVAHDEATVRQQRAAFLIE